VSVLNNLPGLVADWLAPVGLEFFRRNKGEIRPTMMVVAAIARNRGGRK
jgi:hypothetical protein